MTTEWLSKFPPAENDPQVPAGICEADVFERELLDMPEPMWLDYCAKTGLGRQSKYVEGTPSNAPVKLTREGALEVDDPKIVEARRRIMEKMAARRAAAAAAAEAAPPVVADEE